MRNQNKIFALTIINEKNPYVQSCVSSETQMVWWYGLLRIKQLLKLWKLIKYSKWRPNVAILNSLNAHNFPILNRSLWNLHQKLWFSKLFSIKLTYHLSCGSPLRFKKCNERVRKLFSQNSHNSLTAHDHIDSRNCGHMYCPMKVIVIIH